MLPTFPIAIEMNSRSNWSIHNNVSKTVDLLLKGKVPIHEIRKLKQNGTYEIQSLAKNRSKLSKISIKGLDKSSLKNDSIKDHSEKLLQNNQF